MSKNQEYAAQYAEAAKEQMRRYGIPASVILAQGILESSNGQSELSRTCNNHFGIKASASWLKNGGEYALFTDDKPNEKFCKYATVADSYEHHSQILKNSNRYRQCFTLSPDDYKGWTRGIERGGYATGGSYANNLQRIIEANGLQKYDQQVMQEMKAQGREFGVESNPRQSASVSSSPHVETSTSEKKKETSEYAFPVSRKDFLFITSPFGMRQDPMDKSKQQMHKGIDIRTNHEAVLATENGGKVVAVNQNTNTAWWKERDRGVFKGRRKQSADHLYALGQYRRKARGCGESRAAARHIGQHGHSHYWRTSAFRCEDHCGGRHET